MKVPYSWLKKIISLRLTPESLAEKLTMAGLEVAGIDRDVAADAVLDIDVTSNRPDCLAVLGIAREVNAILSSGSSRDKKIRFPSAKFKESKEPAANNVEVRIQDKNLCHRYTARLMRNVKVKESPPWLKKRLNALGLRPINNIVDITNYVLMEYGQPLHAFDFKKIKDGKIIVRRAREGEEIITLDGVKRKLDKSILVISDEEKPQAIAGIMGGAESQVTDETTDILIESAYFEAPSIRRASRKLGLSTDSSYRFERGGDKEAVEAASKRAVSLIQELTGAEALKGKVDEYPRPFRPLKIYLRLRRLKEILGVEVEKFRIKSIFNALGLKIEKSDGELWRIRIPSFRRDLAMEIDLIEEIARHFKYSRIPATLPSVSIKPAHREFGYDVYETCREIMVSTGFQEVVTFSFHSIKESERINLPSTGKGDRPLVLVKNPLSEEQGVMRYSLSQGLLSVAGFNLNMGEQAINIFELGKVFFLKTNEPQEEYCLGGLSLENSLPAHWKGDSRKIDFYDIKGIIEIILNRLGVDDFNFCKAAIPHLREGASSYIFIGAKNAGWVGEISEKILADYGIKERAFMFELCLSDIIPSVRRTTHFKELPKFPPTFRDISIIAEEGIDSKTLTETIRKSCDIYLEKTELVDIYRGEQISPGYRSLTCRLTFRSSQRTLREEEVNGFCAKIISALKSEFSVELRGNYIDRENST